MPTTPPQHPALDLSWLPGVLAGVAYVPDAIAALPGLAPSGRVASLREALDATDDPSPASAAIRLFLLAQTVSDDAVDQLMGGALRTSALVGAGLLGRVPGGFKATCAIQGVTVHDETYYFARDFAPDVLGGDLASDHVLGVALATRTLASHTVRHSVARALDIGTGQGYQAILASRHARGVVATDVSPRALRLASLTASINAHALANAGPIELREGGLYHPIAPDERFGLIVSNPPFVIAPPHALVGVGGTHEGDALVEEMLRGAAPRLEEGGYACVFCNWHHPDASSWRSRPQAWLSGLGVDVLIQRLRTDTPEGYAQRWIREMGFAQSTTSGSTPGLDRWTSYYASLGIGGISLGMIYLRRRTPRPGQPANWFRADVLDEARFAGGSSGNQVHRIMVAQTLLEHAKASPEALLDSRPRFTSDHELEQQLKAALGEGWHVTGSVLRQPQGYQFPIRLQGGLMDLIVRFDGIATLREIVTTMAHEAGAEPSALMAQAPMVVSRLANDGYLEFAE
jgi:hypothetical protein